MASSPHLARTLTALAACAFVVVSACKKSSPEPGAEPKPTSAMTVVAVNYPLAYFAEHLAPEGTEVALPVPADIDPAFWTPTPEEVSRAQAADLILLNGAGYARWTRVATLPKARVVVTAEGCAAAFLPSGEARTHRHGPEGEHAHEGTAFTTWLDLGLARCQAERVKVALQRKAPTESAAIDGRFTALARDLAQLDGRLRKAGEALDGQPALASHPVYQYLAAAYDLNLRSLHFEPDQALDAAAVAELDAALAEHPASMMLWEAEPRAETAELLRERGVAVVVFEPAGNRPSKGDFIEVMEANASRLECAAGADGCAR